jgi:hypothetical protein
MNSTAVWHGSAAESFELTRILSMRCTCGLPESQARRCSGHDMLFDQRIVDGLLFARRIVEQLVKEEFTLKVYR